MAPYLGRSKRNHMDLSQLSIRQTARANYAQFLISRPVHAMVDKAAQRAEKSLAQMNPVSKRWRRFLSTYPIYF